MSSANVPFKILSRVQNSGFVVIRANQIRNISRSKIDDKKVVRFPSYPHYKPDFNPKPVPREILDDLKKPHLVPKLTRDHFSPFEGEKTKKDWLNKRNELKVDLTLRASKVLYEDNIPITFPQGIICRSQLVRPLYPERTLSPEEYKYPYKYYEISLKRSHIGMDKIYKDKLKFLGLMKIGQVTWWLVHPFSAARILEVRHLINLRLANVIPQEVSHEACGYTVKSNIFAEKYQNCAPRISC